MNESYLKKWSTLNSSILTRKIKKDLDYYEEKKEKWLRKIENEKIANFSMITCMKNQIVILSEKEKILTQKFCDTVEEMQTKIKNLKNKANKQKELIIHLQNEIKIFTKFFENEI